MHTPDACVLLRGYVLDWLYDGVCRDSSVTRRHNCKLPSTLDHCTLCLGAAKPAHNKATAATTTAGDSDREQQAEARASH